MIYNKTVKGLALSAVLLSGSAQAVTIGGENIGAFAGTPISMSGSFSFTNADLLTAVTDQDLDTYVTATSTPSTLGLSFASGALVNGAGADLVLFGVGTEEDSFRVTVGANSLDVVATDSGLTTPDGLQLNKALVNLDSLFVANGSSVTSIVLTFTDTTSDFALAGALNPPPAVVPVPAAVWMFGSGLIGLVGVARRRRA